jgi:hypothetical protein
MTDPIIYRPAAYDERAELLSWLEQAKTTLAKYDVDEIAHFAKLNDFDEALIYSVVSHWVVDRETHTSYKIREDWNVHRELCGALGVLNLTEQWMALYRKIQYDKDWEEAL